MDYVKGRVSEYLKLKDGQFLSIGMIDEIMFGIKNVLDYRAVISIEEKIVISLSIKPVDTQVPIKFSDIEKDIRQDKYLGLLIANQTLHGKQVFLYFRNSFILIGQNRKVLVERRQL